MFAADARTMDGVQAYKMALALKEQRNFFTNAAAQIFLNIVSEKASQVTSKHTMPGGGHCSCSSKGRQCPTAACLISETANPGGAGFLVTFALVPCSASLSRCAQCIAAPASVTVPGMGTFAVSMSGVGTFAFVVPTALTSPAVATVNIPCCPPLPLVIPQLPSTTPVTACPTITSATFAPGPPPILTLNSSTGAFVPGQTFVGLELADPTGGDHVVVIAPNSPGETMSATQITISPPAISPTTFELFSAFTSNSCISAIRPTIVAGAVGVTAQNHSKLTAASVRQVAKP